MELSLFYFAFILFTLLSIADPIKSDKQSPTSRRLLLFGGFNLPVGEKKTHHKTSSSKPSSPPKYARSSNSHGLTVFIRPQTSMELGHKIRSFSHLLKSKLYTDEEKAILKRLQLAKKKQIKKKNSTQQKPLITTKTQELVAIDDDELNRCKALLHIDSTTTNDIKPKKAKKDKSIKQEISTKVKNATTQAVKNIKKKVTATTTALPPVNGKKIKTIKRNSKTNPDEKKPVKTSVDKTSTNQPVTPPVNNKPIKTSSPPPPPPSPAPPLQPSTTTKSKRDQPKIISIIQEALQAFDTNGYDTNNKNNSVVDRAYHFFRNMFQLSDDSLDDNSTPEDQIIDITNEQQQGHHHSRKLLTINEDDEISTIILNDTSNYESDLYLTNDQPIEITDDLSFVVSSISKRQLLSVKTNKHSTTSSKSSNTKDKKAKTTYADANKPKVGWAYRYRISRYLDAQKMKRTGNKNRLIGGGKTKPSQQNNHKKSSSSSNTKVAKRKLLGFINDDDDDSSWERDEISDQNITNTVTITENFVPKRHLLSTKTKDKSDKDNNTDDENDRDKTNTRRQMKSFEELTDPIAIVQVYDQGLYKPRVGWQFRYRVSRYIDSLRENIREDQERLKFGLQAIKRKTPQELSGRRKRVLDKPFAPDQDELKKQKEKKVDAQENKPHVGWRYRYRISKMLDAKKRGKYIDDEEEKRKARTEPKKKRANLVKSQDDDSAIEEDLDPELSKINDEGRRIGWEYRYRIRRKLDHLKRQQIATGVSFDLATLKDKREKKLAESKVKSTEKKTSQAIEQKPENKTKSVGWKYRYRVSKMREAQKREKSKPSTSKKQDPIPVEEQLDAELAQLTPEERTAGWKYRYRIRRKLDSTKNAASREHETGKRAKKSSSKQKDKKMIKKVEESIENILNIDDIDETPFMEYFRRTSSYILSGLVPTAKKSVCLLPLPITFSFCNEENKDKKLSTTGKSKKKLTKKLKTKKEHRAKQFIRSHITKLGAEDKITERRVDEAMKKLYKKPSFPPLQTVPSSENTEKTERTHSPRRPEINEQVKHVNEEDYPITKRVGVDSKKNKNKKQFQIIGQEVKVKHKHTAPPSIVENSETATSSPRLRSISEIIQEEAATILAPRRLSSITPEEIKYEINEANESVQERTKLTITTTTPPPTLIDSTTSGEKDIDLTLSDNHNKIHGENVKENMLNVENNKDSS